MMTIHEVSRITGLTIRALQYYDNIGLLEPADVTETGYRLYDDESLYRIHEIMLFRELGFPLKEIKEIVHDPSVDRGKVLEQQIVLLKLRREKLDELIALAEKIRETGERSMDFDVFDKRKIEEYEKKAKDSWGNTEAYREYEKKSENRTEGEKKDIGMRLMDIFSEFGAIKDTKAPGSPEAQAIVQKLRDFITANYYNCTVEILKGLGTAYGAEGEMKSNIDRHAGEGTGTFASKAVEEYCR